MSNPTLACQPHQPDPMTPTDCQRNPQSQDDADAKRPFRIDASATAEARNLVNIFCALNDQSVEQVLADVGRSAIWHIQPKPRWPNWPYRKWARSPREMSRP